MSEFEINQRRNWKAQTFPYDYYLPDDTRECTYCLTDKQAEILRGIIEPLGWATRWWSDSDAPIVKDEIQAFRDDIIRRLMMSCCGDENPILFRWSGDGVLQQSTDDGETWTDAPQKDPRNSSTTFPPMTGDDGNDKKCLAATGMVALIKSQVGDNLTDDMSAYTLAQLIKDWVTTVIQTSNPFQALITIAANQIFALVISLLRAALTDTVYDTLKCIFYCRMASDASFDDARVARVRSDIGEQIGGIATLFLQQLIFLLGAVGMTNLARSGGATSGDCSACDCPLDCPDRWNAFGDTILTNNGDGSITAQSYFNGSQYAILIGTADGNTNTDCCNMSDFTIDVGAIGGGSGAYDCGSDTFNVLSSLMCVYFIEVFSGSPVTITYRPTDC